MSPSSTSMKRPPPLTTDLLAASTGRTAIFITHDAHFAAAIRLTSPDLGHPDVPGPPRPRRSTVPLIRRAGDPADDRVTRV
jgi:hypothetical protein